MHDIPLWTGAGHQIEYPALNKMVSQITGRKQEIASIYSYNIGDLPDINVPASFNFCKDTNMNCLAELLIYIIRHRILEYLDQFNEDAAIIKMFEYNRIWYPGADSYDRKSEDYYLKWTGLCLINRHYAEVVEVTKYAMLNRNTPEIGQYLSEIQRIAEEGEQKESWYLLTQMEEVYIDPTDKELKEFLYHMDGEHQSFFVIVNSITQNYIQIAGASGEFVIEVCEQYGKEQVHYRYGSCIREGKERDLPFQFGFMQVHDTETVSYYETVKVLLKYMRDGCMYRKEKWINITDLL